MSRTFVPSPEEHRLGVDAIGHADHNPQGAHDDSADIFSILTADPVSLALDSIGEAMPAGKIEAADLARLYDAKNANGAAFRGSVAQQGVRQSMHGSQVGEDDAAAAMRERKRAALHPNYISPPGTRTDFRPR